MEPEDGSSRDFRNAVIDSVLDHASERGWDHVRLTDVAEELGVPLAEIAGQFAEKDRIADAWLDRANRCILTLAATKGFRALPVPERIEAAIMAWLGHLAGHKAVARDALVYKMRPAHLHLMAGLVVRLSRTVQWIREACDLDAAGFRKQIEETGLTTLFVSTVIYWSADRSENDEGTRRFLRRGLARSDRLMKRAFG